MAAPTDPRYAKYRRLVRMHMPPAQIKLKLQASDPDLDPSMVFVFAKGQDGATQPKSRKPPPPPRPPGKDPRYKKYERLHKMHVSLRPGSVGPAGDRHRTRRPHAHRCTPISADAGGADQDEDAVR